MLVWILANWRTVMWVTLTTIMIAGTMFLTYKVINWRNGYLQLKSEIAAHSKDIENCNKTATISKDLSHDYAESISSINDEYVSMLEAEYATCMSSSKSGGRNDGSAQTNKLTLSQRRLNDVQAAQLVNCQATVCKIYTANGKANLLPVGTYCGE